MIDRSVFFFLPDDATKSLNKPNPEIVQKWLILAGILSTKSPVVRTMSVDIRSQDILIGYSPVIQILIIVSFFLFLSIGEWIARKLFRAGLVGQLVVGLIYGVSLGNILDNHWQETFVALGYFGLILIVLEGISEVSFSILWC